MKTIELTTNTFHFTDVCFYESMADPRYMPGLCYTDETCDYFHYEKYEKLFIQPLQDYADEIKWSLPGVEEIIIKGIGSPQEYNYQSDWAYMEVRLKDGYKKEWKKLQNDLLKDGDCIEWWARHCKEHPGYIPYECRDMECFLAMFTLFPEHEPERSYGIFLTLLFIHFVNDNTWETWGRITDTVMEHLHENLGELYSIDEEKLYEQYYV